MSENEKKQIKEGAETLEKYLDQIDTMMEYVNKNYLDHPDKNTIDVHLKYSHTFFNDERIKLYK